MQMTHQPNHCRGERDDKNEKHNPAFTSRFAKRTAPPRPPAIVAVTFVLERDRSIEAAAVFVRSPEQLLALMARSFLRQPRRVRDEALKFCHFVPQLRFPAGEFVLFPMQRRGRAGRTTKHGVSPARGGHPEKKKKRDKAENDEWQTEREANLHPSEK
jgi:hypothetical protein